MEDQKTRPHYAAPPNNDLPPHVAEAPRKEGNRMMVALLGTVIGLATLIAVGAVVLVMSQSRVSTHLTKSASNNSSTSNTKVTTTGSSKPQTIVVQPSQPQTTTVVQQQPQATASVAQQIETDFAAGNVGSAGANSFTDTVDGTLYTCATPGTASEDATATCNPGDFQVTLRTGSSTSTSTSSSHNVSSIGMDPNTHDTQGVYDMYSGDQISGPYARAMLTAAANYLHANGWLPNNTALNVTDPDNGQSTLVSFSDNGTSTTAIPANCGDGCVGDNTVFMDALLTG